MNDLRQYVFQFFQEHRSSLSEAYPGLSERRLLQELQDHMSFGLKDTLEFSSQAYLPHRNHPLTQIFEKLKEGIPLAYIFQRAHFAGASFFILPGVFIPRLETEILVEMAREEMKKLMRSSGEQELRLLDLGTGSGIILLSALRGTPRPWTAWAMDICPKALEVAQRNAYQLAFSLHPETQLHFVPGDRLGGLEQKVHLLLTNPPYIKLQADRGSVHWAVDKHEPHGALYLEDEKYLLWFKILFERSLNLLYKGGVLLMEGHENHLQDLKILAESLGFSHVECIKDLSGRDRFLRMRKLS